MDHRLFISSETYRRRDGSHDGKWVPKGQLDLKKMLDYYFEHYAPETWVLHLDNWSPNFYMHINLQLAGNVLVTL